jgi:serine/threonine protein kinase
MLLSENEIVHFDIKPDNILFDKNSSSPFKLIDFGSATSFKKQAG